MATNGHASPSVETVLHDLKNAMRADIAPDPLMQIAQGHNLHELLCHALELIADGLPHEIHTELGELAILILKEDLPLHHKVEEDALFPLLEKKADTENISLITARLSQEHAKDESFAEEIIDSLHNLVHGKLLDNPDMLGYMLRGFFENYRRHLEWENTVILPLAHACFDPQDISDLAASILSLRLTRNPFTLDH